MLAFVDEDRSVLKGMIISHVDDLLFGGDADARNLLIKLGDELGYGSLVEGKFVYCGKLFDNIQMVPFQFP
jgi:hypothetical protein